MKSPLLVCLVLLIGCGPVEPGLLKHTIRMNDDQRAYAQCMQQDRQSNAELRYVCRRWSRFRWTNWAWEDCINEGLRECGDRPRFVDVP